MNDTRTSEARAPSSLDQAVGAFTDMAAADPQRLRDPDFRRRTLGVLVQSAGGEGPALVDLWPRFLAGEVRSRKLDAQNAELVSFVKALKGRPALGWIVSTPFVLNGDGKRYVYAMLLGADETPQCYEIMEEEHGEGEEAAAPPPELPYLGLIEPGSRLFFGAPRDVPPVPVRAEILTAVAARPESKFASLGEIEVTEGHESRAFTVLANLALAREVRQHIEVDGETVLVRAEHGVATAIHETTGRRPEDWLEFPPLEGQSIDDLVLPPALKDRWRKDIRRIVDGESVKALLIGPTGVGKSSACESVGRDACALAASRGAPRKGFALIRLSGPHIGSPFIHEVERTIFKAVKRAESLAAKGHIAIILADEADALLGESDGGFEHSHNRSERLAAQEILGKEMPGVAVYLTMNARPSSWLPPAIARRFERREYPRAGRSQMEAVARLYARRHARALQRIRLAPDEFAAAFIANLWSDERVVAVGHFHSGRSLTVRARDLQTASPGKVKELVEAFASDVEAGEAASLEQLYVMLDREFRAAELTTRNIWELTFLKQPHDDTLRTVEHAV